MSFNPDVPFDTTVLFNMNATDEQLHEQLWAFIREGRTGDELIGMILRSPKKSGIANHVSRLLSILSENVLVESKEEGEAIIASYAK